MREHTTLPQHFNQIFNPLLFVLLLCTDIVFLVLHVFDRLSPLPNALLSLGTNGGYTEVLQYIKEYWMAMPNSLFSVGTDGGYAEVFQYIKEYWIIILLFIVLWRTREGIYASWLLLFTYLLCDDVIAIHESVGEGLGVYWSYPSALGLRARDFGELTVSAVVGSAFLVLILPFYFRCSSVAKIVSKDLTLLLGVLVFFGVFVDMGHAISQSYLLVAGFLAIVEESGEMVSMSIITSYVVNLPQRQTHVSTSLWQLTRAALSSERIPQLQDTK